MKKGDRVYIKHPYSPDQWVVATIRHVMLDRACVSVLINGRVIPLWVKDDGIRKTRSGG